MHPFAEFIRILGRGKHGSRDLSRIEARDAMGMLLRGKCEDLQIGAFLMLLRVKEESPEEVAGFVEAAREACTLPTETLAIDIDWPSYAGKRRQEPWYLLAALALAHSGKRIFLHGSDGHTPDRLYTGVALQRMGIAISCDWQQVHTQLDTTGLACMPLSHFCPALDALIHLKPVLGLRSIANSLVRLLNPLDARLMASSIFHPAYGPLHQQAMLALGTQQGLTFKGDGGEIEIRPDANTTLYRIHHGEPVQVSWPRTLPDRQADRDALSVQCLLDTWHDRDPDHYGQAATLETIAVMLFALGEASDIEDARARARDCWASRRIAALPRQPLT